MKPCECSGSFGRGGGGEDEAQRAAALANKRKTLEDALVGAVRMGGGGGCVHAVGSSWKDQTNEQGMMSAREQQHRE
jgi:hypothetical protein